MNCFKQITLRTLILLTVPLLASGCSDDPEVSPIPQKIVTAVDVPQMLSASHGQLITIKGLGFQAEDQIHFSLAGAVTPMPVKATTEAAASFVLDTKLTTATYQVAVVRGTASQQLGTIALKIIPSMEVEDKDGATIKGVVHNDGSPIANVRVSDGVLFTTTDANGRYWLNSTKADGYVFIILPSGYEPYVFGAVPQFWSTLTMDAEFCERHDFELTAVNNDNHVIIATTDHHMANRNNDLTQYETLYVPDIQATASAQGSKRVYTIALGDMTWDTYWYDKATQYSLVQYRNLISKYPTMIFHAMGNHDNDPYCTNDMQAEKPFRNILGPTYYSFNLGQVHYVILDNMEYTNKGGSQGTIGDREFNTTIVQKQLDWLKEDLKAVSKSTPIVVGMHVPLYRVSVSGGKPTAALNDVKLAPLATVLSAFDNVHVLTGHTHNNTAIARSLTKNSIFEHNIAGLSATWWWTGKLTGNQICRDGSYGGYGVFTATGASIDWYYKSVGQPREKQFRTYDMNKVKSYFSTNTNARAYFQVYPRRENYSKFADNSVLINIWNWDEAWTLKVKEGDRELTATRINGEDPLHTLSYDIPRTVTSGSYTTSFITTNTTHLFSVSPSSATSALTVEVTDSFNRTYTETMTRPKDFKSSMQ